MDLLFQNCNVINNLYNLEKQDVNMKLRKVKKHKNCTVIVTILVLFNVLKSI